MLNKKYLTSLLNCLFIISLSSSVRAALDGDVIETNNSAKISERVGVKPPFNANSSSKYVEMVLVVDNAKFKELNQNTTTTGRYCQNITTIVNQLYAPLNIFVALVDVVIWTERDQIQISHNADQALANFLHYRRQISAEHPNDYAHLLTKTTFEGGTVGRALKGPICTYEFSGAISTDFSSDIGVTATTVAHMLGHNLGMNHDDDNCSCPDDLCILSRSTANKIRTHWSSCSKDSLESAFKHGMSYCLRNKPKVLFGAPVCGNGFVEEGEECDCGAELCSNSCCDALSCKLHANATCATGECCDLTTCSLKSEGFLCRSVDSECDLPEYCSGHDEFCPSDVYKMDGHQCEDSEAYCYEGSCQTRTNQCKLLWGPTGRESVELCYQLNVKGTRHGNCNYDKISSTWSKCNNEDVLCGRLQCNHSNDRLEFGMESVSILSYTFINSKGSIYTCRVAAIDLGLTDMDPGLVPNGAKCGEDKMCVNQKCVNVSSLQPPRSVCQENCYGNGW